MEKPDTCNCCEGLSLETPMEVQNRPGLTAISYRVGDYSKFRESLLARLSRLKTPQAVALRQLTTRNDDDFSIALLDAWAVVSDVLTFYQERIANESYLGTATEQLSIVELARLIGYELHPGVAASTMLAFTLEEASFAAAQAAFTGVARGKEENSPIFIELGTRVQSIPGKDEEPQNFETIEKIEARAEWNAMKPRMTQPYPADIRTSEIIAVRGLANNLKIGDVLLLQHASGGMGLKKVAKVTLKEVEGLTILHFAQATQVPSSYTYASQSLLTTHSSARSVSQDFIATEIKHTWAGEDFDGFLKKHALSEDDVRNGFAIAMANNQSEDAVFVFRKQAAVFGHNAPKEMSFTGNVPDKPSDWDDWALGQKETPGKIYLDAPYEQILPSTYIAIQQTGVSLANAPIYQLNQVVHHSRSEYGISAKSTVLSFSSTANWWGTGTTLASLRTIAVHAQSEELPLAELPIEDPVSGLKVELSRLHLGLKKGQPVIVFGERSEPLGVFASEAKILDKVEIVSGRTVLTFDTALANTYVRKTFSINANVARATHGESTRDVLGSGDAAQAFQKFMLKQPPLTFVTAATPSGVRSTLEVRVNDLLWQEVPSLYGRGPNERIFITRQDDKGRTTLIFGDGKNGSRLPTGRENVVATYRKGIGSKGLLKANQLSQLISRPLGLKAVTNPQPPAGAQNPEQLAAARRNATLTMFTLGRVVSLKDYEEFARAFAGIAKSLATWTWSGLRQEIYLTVAGAKGAQVEASSELYKNLLAAIAGASVPGAGIRLASYLPKYFRFAAKIKVLSEYLSEKVRESIESRLREHFSFDARAFGQPVTKSELISIIQNTEGVDWVDLDALYFSGTTATLNDRLDTALPGFGTSAPLPAELLTLDLNPLEISILS